MKISQRVIIVVILAFFLTAVVLLLYFRQNNQQQFISPLSLNPKNPLSSDLEQNFSKKIVYGFLPFWQTKTFSPQPELTHIAYFSLTLAANGTILIKDNTAADPGYRFFNSAQFDQLVNDNRIQNINTEIVFSLFDNQVIESFLENRPSQSQAINAIQEIISDYSLHGVNIDIEYSGPKSNILQPFFTRFIIDLSQRIKEQNPEINLSIDLYPSAIEQKNIWDIKELAKSVDYIIVMAYDFHRPSSSTAGPIAPLISQEDNSQEKNISRYIAQMTKIMPPEKIILGIPFYGYEWQIVSTNPRSSTYPKSGSTASYQRVQEILISSNKLTDFEHLWENSTLSPYILFEENGKQKVIYYENDQSLQYKLDFVNQSNLAGIAIWALGYEGKDRKLWDKINTNFSLLK